MTIRILSRIDEVPCARWNALLASSNPFLRHEFLSALEHCESVGAQTGWQPCHLVIEGDARGRDLHVRNLSREDRGKPSPFAAWPDRKRVKERKPPRFTS